MKSLKLYKVVNKDPNSKYVPDRGIPYIMAVNEKSVRYAYSNYGLESDEPYDFIVVDELQPTKENMLAVMLFNFSQENNWLSFSGIAKLKSKKHLKAYWDTTNYFSKKVSLSKVYNIKKLGEKIKKTTLKKIKTQKNIIKENKTELYELYSVLAFTQSLNF